MQLPLLKISENRRFLVTEDGDPFFWLGDTAWELFHKLNREEADWFLKLRSEQGFTVIQAVALAEIDGLEVPNAHGSRPLKKNAAGEYDPTLPDLAAQGEYGYWDHVDYIMDKAEEYGLYIALLPTWGDKFNLKWGKGPVIFNESNARTFGEWLGTRYKDRTNIIWVLGGDRPFESLEHPRIVRAMAEGLKGGDGGLHLMTFHPPGNDSSSRYVHYENWLDFDMIQSGHMFVDYDNGDYVRKDYSLPLTKPVLDGEPRYEDHPIGFKPANGYFRAPDVRQAAYWAVFAGAFGHTYGHHCIWYMNTEPTDYWPLHWKDAAVRPGAGQMKHLRSLLESRPFLERVPAPSIAANKPDETDRIYATRGSRYALYYTSKGVVIQAVLGVLEGDRVLAQWYNPRTGEYTSVGEYPNRGITAFTPPSSGRDHDWVLVLDSIL